MSFGRLVREGELLQHVGASRGDTRLPRLLGRRQLEFLEQDDRQLLRRVDVELFPGQFEDPRALRGEIGLDPLRLAGKGRQIDTNSRLLDIGKHPHERKLQVPKKPLETLFAQLCVELCFELPR